MDESVSQSFIDDVAEDDILKFNYFSSLVFFLLFLPDVATFVNSWVFYFYPQIKSSHFETLTLIILTLGVIFYFSLNLIFLIFSKKCKKCPSLKRHIYIKPLLKLSLLKIIAAILRLSFALFLFYGVLKYGSDFIIAISVITLISISFFIVSLKNLRNIRKLKEILYRKAQRAKTLH